MIASGFNLTYNNFVIGLCLSNFKEGDGYGRSGSFCPLAAGPLFQNGIFPSSNQFERFSTTAYINARKDWQLPEFRMLRGKEGKAGLSEIRWESEGTQWRVLGFFGLGRL